MSFSRPIISVIIPVYNHYADLFKTLKSVYQQSIGKKSIEVIVVDDGSDVKGVKKDQELFKIALPQVKFFIQPHRGAPAARNFGFQQSSGEFVIFWDADIEANKSFLEKLLKILRDNPTAAYAYSSFYFGWKKFPGQKFDPVNLKKFNFIPMSSLIKRQDFCGFDEKMGKFQDWDLWLTLLEKGKQGIWVPEFLFKAKVRRGGLSSWLPSFIYKIKWLPLPALSKYNYWKEIINQKHHLS